MGFLVSPGVEVKEIDMTNSIPALSTSIGGYVGPFKSGPIGQIVTIGSEKDLARIFGAPTQAGDEYERSFFTAASFLKYARSLKVVRSVEDGDLNAASDGTGVQIQSELDSAIAANKMYAKYPGTNANGITIELVTEGNYNAYEYAASNFTYVPGTTEYYSNLGGENDEVHVIIKDGDGTITGVANSVLEIFEGLSLYKYAKTADGANNYIVDVLNRSSQYVYSAALDETTSDVESIANVETDILFTLSGGTNASTITTGAITAGLDYFADAELTDINFLFTSQLGASQSTIDIALLDIGDNRKDILTFVSAPYTLYTEIESDKLETVKSNISGLSSSSYAVFDSSPVQMYNKYADSYVWVPSCGHVAGLCANADYVAEPWFSPAGLTRGQLRGVIKLAYNPGQAERDELYKARINPIVSLPGQGIVLYGDKTALSKPSAFDRINVRRLFITLEKAIATFAKFQLFELNDEFTRASFRAAVEPYLRDVQGRRGITDFRVICDTTNNTGEVIDSNRFVADIYIKPARSINFITLNFIATRTGVEFKEIIGG